MKLLINILGKRKLLDNKIKNDLHTEHGVIKKKDFNNKKNGIIKSHNGKKFLILKPNFKDLFDKIKRGPQIITLKDAGFIASQLGIMNGSKVLDCGSGSGAMTCFLANIAGSRGKIISVDKEKKFCEITRSNVDLFGFKNVKIICRDIKDFKDKGFDAANLDLPNPEKIMPVIKKCLKQGGMLSVYVPNTTQVTSFLDKMDKSFKLLGVYEIIKRKWKTGKGIMRPESKNMHTGFVIILRYLEGLQND